VAVFYWRSGAEIHFSRCNSQPACYTFSAMADNNDILKAIESIKSDVGSIKNDLQDVKQSQAQTNTALEAVAAGQKDQASKADIHRLEQKIDKVDKHLKSHESRIDNLETSTNTPNPHKN
jgi:septal ring factor EnvC (AmiA/AmiB activator)